MANGCKKESDLKRNGSVCKDNVVSKEETVTELCDEHGNNEIKDTQNLKLRPILLLLGLAGCYTFQDDKYRVINAFVWIYKIVIFAASPLWTCRFFVELESLSQIVSAVTTTMYSLQCMGNWLICWKLFSKRYGNFTKSLDEVKNTMAEMSKNDIKINYDFINKRQIIFIGAAVFLVLTNSLIQLLNTYIFDENLGNFIGHDFNSSSDNHGGTNQTIEYFTFPFQDNYFTRFVVLLPLLFLVTAHVIPPFYLTIVSTILRALFKALNKHLDETLRASGGDLDNVERYRQHHLRLSNLIASFDEGFQYLYGNIFFWNILQSISTLYMIIKFEQHLIVIFGLLHLMVLSVTVLVVMAISAAQLHEEAHAPLNIIYNINVDTISLEKATQLNLFLSKLTGSQIGFTTFGLLTITKEFILTIAGVFLTYFAVLYTL